MASGRAEEDVETGVEPGWRWRPSEFMRARRPELYSDSKPQLATRLRREVFEYHLETLTQRKQEIEFEHFARRLAEKELCPNLLPQTGPTGGGDSKVDSETYPVAAVIAERWYVGTNPKPTGSESWAFAFSAKKDWRAKVRKDVEGIVTTGRPYTLIYFVTNQAVRDKARAEVEAALLEKHGLPVRVLDRTWIVTCVYDHGRLDLAAQTLKLEVEHATTSDTGPLDVQRGRELRLLEAEISDPARYVGVSYQLIEDCLSAAILARGLNLSRVDVDGRFDRAERLATSTGGTSQLARIIYEKAWTAFWWYDDPASAHQAYDRVEELVADSVNYGDLELLGNLCSVLYTSFRRKALAVDLAILRARQTRLRSALGRIADDANRPNTAAKARSHLLLMDLEEAVPDSARLEPVFGEFKTLLESVDGLMDFPVERVMTVLRELGALVPESSAYESLFEVILPLVEKRASAAAAGKALLERGLQKRQHGKQYDAIRLLGRAQLKLALKETRRECARALAGCGSAYEAVGLYWAARGRYLAAAHLVQEECHEQGGVQAPLAACFRRLSWIELRLGRIPQALAWIEAALLLNVTIKLEGEQRDRVANEIEAQDALLGALLLELELPDLQEARALPAILDRFGLTRSWMALLYALGEDDVLRDGGIPKDEPSEAVRDFFSRWSDEARRGGLSRPTLNLAEEIVLRSRVLGSRVVVATPKTPYSVALAEAILAALEGYLATTIELAYPHLSELRIAISAGVRPAHEFDTSGSVVAVTLPLDGGEPSRAQREAFHAWLEGFLIECGARLAFIINPAEYAKQLIVEERAVDRATAFADADILVGNLLGKDWNVLDLPQAQTGEPAYELRRSERWDAQLASLHPELVQATSLLPSTELRHDQRVIHSLIDTRLWDQAKWNATAYGSQPYPGKPLFILAFTDGQFGRHILNDLIAKVGVVDEHDEIRVSIVTGIDRQNPTHYRVVIGTNPRLGRDVSEHDVFVSRINTMRPAGLTNLDRFLNDFSRLGAYDLLVGEFDQRGLQLFPEKRIEKRVLRIVPAWQVDVGDPDITGVRWEDEPIVPEGTTDVPFIRVKKWLERLRASQQQSNAEG